jgi:hypothetical protein
MTAVIQVVIDCQDPDSLATFWANALGYRKDWTWDPEQTRGMLDAGLREDQINARCAVSDPNGRGPRLFFQRVPEPKVVKNRLHLDLQVGREQAEAEVERLVGLGGRRVRTQEGDFGPFRDFALLMEDPEGNEFCVT